MLFTLTTEYLQWRHQTRQRQNLRYQTPKKYTAIIGIPLSVLLATVDEPLIRRFYVENRSFQLVSPFRFPWISWSNGSHVVKTGRTKCWKLSSQINRDLTQQQRWKTQDGRMTKKCRARPGMHSLVQHFFVILPSRVFQPSCCLRSLIMKKIGRASCRERV